MRSVLKLAVFFAVASASRSTVDDSQGSPAEIQEEWDEEDGLRYYDADEPRAMLDDVSLAEQDDEDEYIDAETGLIEAAPKPPLGAARVDDDDSGAAPEHMPNADRADDVGVDNVVDFSEWVDEEDVSGGAPLADAAPNPPPAPIRSAYESIESDASAADVAVAAAPVEKSTRMGRWGKSIKSALAPIGKIFARRASSDALQPESSDPPVAEKSGGIREMANNFYHKYIKSKDTAAGGSKLFPWNWRKSGEKSADVDASGADDAQPPPPAAAAAAIEGKRNFLKLPSFSFGKAKPRPDYRFSSILREDSITADA